jgi:hypothetical protein
MTGGALEVEATSRDSRTVGRRDLSLLAHVAHEAGLSLGPIVRATQSSRNWAADMRATLEDQREMWTRGKLQTVVVTTGLFISGSIGIGFTASKTFTQLNADKIRNQIIGRVIEEEVDRHWAFYFQQGGLLDTREMLKKLNGRWEIQGDRLCFALKGEEMVCYGVWVLGTAFGYEPARAIWMA